VLAVFLVDESAHQSEGAEQRDESGASPGAGDCEMAVEFAEVVARSQLTSTVHKKRNQRRRSIPYERCVDAERPHACSSLRYALTGSRTVPLASTSRNGSNRSSLASTNPRWDTTNDDRSRGASAVSVTERKRSQGLLDLSAQPQIPSDSSVNRASWSNFSTR
jgi:hypothetical protein